MLFRSAPAYWGYTMPSPDLLSCDLSASSPLCMIRMLIAAPDGSRKNLGTQALRFSGDSWKFAGEGQAMQVRTETAVRLRRRIDGATPVDSYSRSLGLFIPVQIGLACVKVTQLDSSGINQTIAFFKPLPASSWMSLLRVDADDGPASTVLGQGSARVGDDVWIPMQTGASGDAVARFEGSVMPPLKGFVSAEPKLSPRAQTLEKSREVEATQIQKNAKQDGDSQKKD